MTGGNGKVIAESGDEALEVMVTAFEDKVVVHLNQSREFWAMSAQQASIMAEQMSRVAFFVHYGKEAPDRGSELARQVKAKAVDEVRPRLINRHAQMLRSFVTKDPAPTPEYMAERLVDAVLKEVT